MGLTGVPSRVPPRAARVLLIASAYPRAPGDVITPWLGEAVRRLGEAGVAVEVLAPAYRALADHVIDGVPVHRFRYAPSAWERLTHEQTAPDRIRERPAYAALVPSYVASGSVAAVRLARTGRFDVVHALWPLPHGVFGLAARRMAGVPLVCTFFGAELSWLAARSRVMRGALHGVLRGADAVTAISRSTADRLTALAPGARVVTIPFGAAVEVPPRRGPRAPSPGAHRILFVGRLVERKGVHVLLDAVARLAARPAGPAPALDVVGEGPERGALEARAARLGIADRVRFHGRLPAGALAARYAACDAFVLPAVVDGKGDTEGLGVVLLEALAHGKPVIASALGGIPDIVRDDVTGVLVPPADPGALADAIGALAAEPARARRLAAAGRRHLETEFAWPSIVRRLVDVYARVARPGGVS